MVAEALTQIPDEFIAGDTFAWTRTLDDYPAPTWTLKYYFSKPDHNFSITASADGTDHAVSVAGGTTTSYQAGRYRWHARVDDGTTFVTVENGWIDIRPDPTRKNVDWRGHARIMLDAIEATLEGKANKEQIDLLSYSFGAVNVSRDSKVLLDARDKYAREVRDELPGGRSNRFIGIRFRAP